jgi:hypothetical protein
MSMLGRAHHVGNRRHLSDSPKPFFTAWYTPLPQQQQPQPQQHAMFSPPGVSYSATVCTIACNSPPNLV